jgi:FkbH-like protein
MSSAASQRSGTVAIAATFTAEPLLQSLNVTFQEAGLNLDVRFAPYNQVFQELLQPSGLLASNAGGVNVVLARLEDFVRDVKTVALKRQNLDQIASELCSALTGYAQRVNVPTIFAAFRPSPRLPEALLSDVENATQVVMAHARQLPGIIALTPGDIDRVSSGEKYDELGDDLAHIPFSDAHYSAIALAIARKVHALRVPAQKVLALDCDQTLWTGVVGEDGVSGITIPPHLARLQRFAVEMQARGALICLVSKNAERDVLEVFERRQDMILKLDQVVAHRINWLPKPQNLADLARALNLGLDSFVFIDDNPVECALMRSELPQVITLMLPPDDQIDSFLANLWVFDEVAVTEEDTRRTAMYRENVARQDSENTATDIAGFIASLEVVTDIAAPDDNEWPRVAQLSQRTNQFNFTTIRRSEPEMRALLTDNCLVLRVRVKDRFGDYGLVGVTIAKPAADALVVDTFFLSCRVLGRGVEHTILRRLGEIAKERSLSHLDLRFVATPKNEPARAFADSVAAQFLVHEPDGSVYRIPVDAACNISHRPGHDPAAVIEARKSEETKNAKPSKVRMGAERSERYQRLALTLTSGERIQEAVRSSFAGTRRLATAAILPATETERRMCALWQDMLGLSEIGVEDDYFTIGGTSLGAARLFARIGRQFGIHLPLTAILEAPTVRALAARIDQGKMPESDSLFELKRGGQRNLFLVHDGDGEILLYLNLARQLPPDIGVFGLKPSRRPGIPLTHTSIEAMATSYLNQVRAKQPHGPYLFGGMCAGGVIAHEMAFQAERQGEKVELVAILDAARPHTQKRRGLITKQRLSRLQSDLGKSGTDQKGKLLLFALPKILSKVTRAASWEISQRVKHATVTARFWLLRRLLARQAAWPARLPSLTFREIYDTAEQRYVPKSLVSSTTLVVRARAGEGNDTPYKEIYAEETLGWSAVANNLTLADVNGGHSSMLQVPFVDGLAEVLGSHIARDKDPFVSERETETLVP